MNSMCAWVRKWDIKSGRKHIHTHIRLCEFIYCRQWITPFNGYSFCVADSQFLQLFGQFLFFFYFSILIYFNVVCAFFTPSFFPLFLFYSFLIFAADFSSLFFYIFLFLVLLLNQQCKNILHYRKHKVFLHVWLDLPHHKKRTHTHKAYNKTIAVKSSWE